MTSASELVKERTKLLARIEEINAELILMKTKQCSKCKKIKSSDEFYRQSVYKDGLFPRCKQCMKEYNHKRYVNNPEYQQAYAANRRALGVAAEGTFTGEQFAELCKQYDNRCLCCGNVKKLTVDHVVPLSKGGSNDIDNIQPLCQPCNLKKRVQTIDYRTKPSLFSDLPLT